MILLKLLAAAIVVRCGQCQSQKILQHQTSDPYAPNLESARRNSNLIFNAIHSSMRQWGSSLQHNGLSFFLAYIPEGTVLYHGNPKPDIPSTREWLAFEIEHATMFAKYNPGTVHNESEANKFDPLKMMATSKLDGEPSDANEPSLPLPGYLQIYRTTRPLDRVLYFDGSSAGNSPYGTLDTQDLVFLNKSRPALDDFNRADDLCALGAEWNIEAFIRMEAGFELIKCNFSDGLALLSARQSANQKEPTGFDSSPLFEYTRSVSARYEGITSHRVTLDYSSMVSSYFYNTNLSNTEIENFDTLPRIINTEPEQLYRIRSDLKDILARERSFQSSIDWQGVVDMIVSRYSGRLQMMAGGIPDDQFLVEINTLLNMFVDYGVSASLQDWSVKECSLHYLQPLAGKNLTEQDHMISAAIEQVTNKICQTLFEVREILLNPRAGPDVVETRSGVALIQELNEWLNWTVWKFCGHCKSDQVCFVAAWLFGLKEDHFNPQCRNYEEMKQRWHMAGYWFPE